MPASGARLRCVGIDCGRLRGGAQDEPIEQIGGETSLSQQTVREGVEAVGTVGGEYAREV